MLVIIAYLSINGLIPFAAAQDPNADALSSGIIAIAASIAVGLSVLGAGLALKTVATAAISAITEREGSFGQILVLVALAEALAIYGVVVGILLLQKIP
ncbi:MAG: ATP synthase subunit C [Promethearchaeota archaeon]